MPTTILDGETYQEALTRRCSEEAEFDKRIGERKRKILEAAAKAMQDAGDKNFRNFYICDHAVCLELSHRRGAITGYWNPLTNSADTAAMCARLDINTCFYQNIAKVECSAEDAGHVVKHDGTPEGKEAAWRLAATMVAAKIGGYVDE
jgi:hypothetical protein